MKINIKRLPNYISLLRIIGTIILILLTPFSIEFFSLYLLCGLSDVLDGYIARKFKVSSKLGAKLDSLADTFFIIVILIKVIPVLKLDWWMILWITLIAIIRVLALIIIYIRFKEKTFLHTYGNKITGMVLFFLPLIYNLVGLNIAVSIICFIATLSAFEEMLINIIIEKVNLDIKGIYDIIRKNKWKI